jgi:hypothetical protein
LLALRHDGTSGPADVDDRSDDCAATVGRSLATDRARREPASRRSDTGAVSGERYSRVANRQGVRVGTIAFVALRSPRRGRVARRSPSIAIVRRRLLGRFLLGGSMRPIPPQRALQFVAEHSSGRSGSDCPKQKRRPHPRALARRRAARRQQALGGADRQTRASSGAVARRPGRQFRSAREASAALARSETSEIVPTRYAAVGASHSCFGRNR